MSYCQSCAGLQREVVRLREERDQWQQHAQKVHDAKWDALIAAKEALEARLASALQFQDEVNVAHIALDDIGAPRQDGAGVLSITGRCWALSNRWAALQEDLERQRDELAKEISPKHAKDWPVSTLAHLAACHREDSEVVDAVGVSNGYSVEHDYDAARLKILERAESALSLLRLLVGYGGHKPECQFGRPAHYANGVPRGFRDDCTCRYASLLEQIAQVMKDNETTEWVK